MATIGGAVERNSVKFSRRLGERVRAIARSRVGPAPGPTAVYANILDGVRLWLALEKGAGVPALRDLATGDLIRPESDLPAGHGEYEPDYRSVRWALDDLLPGEDEAVCEVVALSAPGSEPQPVGVGQLSRAHAVLHPPTPDGAWMFRLERTPRGVLHIRRVRAQRVAGVLHAAFVEGCAVITCETLGRESADLLLMDKEGLLAARLPMRRTALGFERVISEEDVPKTPIRYRVMFGSEGDRVPVARLRNDLAVADAATVLMPLVLARNSEAAVARVRYALDGTLLVARFEPVTEGQA